jgi:hypothetical protein
MTQPADPRPGRYYVTVRDGPQVGLLAGPFPTHQQALDLVPAVRDLACQVNTRAWFYAYGTSRVHDGEPDLGPGRLNHLLPEEVRP